MKIVVKVKAGRKKQGIEKIDENNYVVSVSEPPVEGKANRAVVKLLAEYFKTSSSQIAIISGQTSKQKIVEIF